MRRVKRELKLACERRGANRLAGASQLAPRCESCELGLGFTENNGATRRLICRPVISMKYDWKRIFSFEK